MLRVLIVSVLLWLPPTSAWAADPSKRITQYAHTAWRVQDGAFASPPNAIAQTADGYIWIGSDSGLMKYDGVRFVSWAPGGARPFSSPVYSLLASSDGTLWIGTGSRLLSWRNNDLREHVRGRINTIVEDRKRRIWVARSRPPDSSGGLCQVSGEQPRCIGGDEQMRLPYAVALAEDVHGNLWIGTSNQLMRWRDGGFETYFRGQLERFQGLASVESIVAPPDGSVWAAIPRAEFGLIHIADNVARKTVFPGTDATQVASLFIDRDRSLWVGTSNDGVYRVSGDRVDHFRSADGLTGDVVRKFFEDREGNLWVATSKGLDCFRDTRVVTFSAREGLATDLAASVLASGDGRIWIGNRTSLNVIEADRVSSIPIPGQRVTSLWQDHAKRLWVGVDNRLTVYERGQFRDVSRPDGRPLGTAIAITEDREQNLWVSAVGADRKLFRIRDLRVEEEFAPDQIPFARLLAADPTGGIWLGLADGNLAHYESGKLEVFPLSKSEQALPGLAIDGDGSAWASTQNGIVHWKNREMKTLSSKNGLPCDAAVSAIRDARATLWVYAKCGLIAIADSELARWWQQPDTTVQFLMFDVFDGAMPGLSTFQPAVSRSPDGRLWFVNDAVVQMLDPGGSRSNPLAPPVHVEGIRADRQDYGVDAPIQLPARSRDIEIRYTALSFAVPQKVQFRYRLEGRDHEWQDAGTRRQAFYNDLGPGTYRFRVIASNNDGLWNEEGASLEIVIAPAWYQTQAFLAASLLVGAFAMWAAYRLRMRQVARALNARFDERLAERTRMARDLHDTLLQTVQGSKMVADTALDRPDDAERLARALKQVSAWLGQVGEEGRATVNALRTSTADDNDLAEAFRRAIEDLRRESAIDASLTVTGDARELHPVARDEIYRIGYEAIRNARTHSRARRLDVSLSYGHELTLRVADDGVGMELAMAERGRDGHFGLRGMRERAAHIGAHLSVTGAPGKGTVIVVTVPGRVIYRKASTNLGTWFGVGVLLLSLGGPAVAAAGRTQSAQPATTGRVVATITTLEGTVHMPGIQIELRDPDARVVIARTSTDGAGQVTFPDVPVGRYLITASGPGFMDRDSAVFAVRANETAQVILDAPLTFVLPGVQVRADTPSPTDSVQPVSMSDMLSGSLFETAPLEGDDFRSLLPLLPGVVRDGNGRLRIKGGQPTQGALQISSASLVDPSTGDFDLDLPTQAVDSVEVMANPFAAEYGRFSTSITQIRTRGGTNDWDFSIGNLVPRFRGLLRGVRGFEPRASLRGPIRRDRLFVAQDFQFRYVATPVKSLPDEPEVVMRSFDSFTRLDNVISARHLLSGVLVTFPREIERVTMNTFRPAVTTPEWHQEGWSAGGVDRLAIVPNLVLESTLSLRHFEIEVDSDNHAPMVYAPETQSGGFFNDQERDVRSYQWVEALSLTRDLFSGQHVFKFGTDLQRSAYTGSSASRPVEIRRLDGSLAERTEFGAASAQSVDGTEFAVFAQDRWRVNSRLTFELGLRVDRDGVGVGRNWSPRAGAAIAILPEGRAIVRGGFGKFAQRTPLNVGAFGSFEPRTISRFNADGSSIGQPITLTNTVEGPLRTPEAEVGNIEWDQRFGRRVLLKVAFLGRSGSHEHVVSPDPATGTLRLASIGASGYRELESTVRYLGGERRDLTMSYVWARGEADLNNYDDFYGNFRHPIVRANQRNLISTDVRHRLLLRGTIGLPGKWDVAPVLELRSGFPWSAIDEFHDFVGPRSRSGRLPAVRTLDFSIARPWQFKKRRFRAGIKVFNLFGASAYRDIQTNTTSPFYGTPYNPVERSVGFVFGSGR